MNHDLTRDLMIRQVRDALPFDGPTRRMFDDLLPTSDKAAPAKLADPVNMPDGEGWVEFISYLRSVYGEFVYLSTHGSLKAEDLRGTKFIKSAIMLLPQWLEKDVAWINLSDATNDAKTVRQRMEEARQEREQHLAKDVQKWNKTGGPSSGFAGLIKEAMSKLGIDVDHVSKLGEADSPEDLEKLVSLMGPGVSVISVNSQEMMNAPDPGKFLQDKIAQAVQDHQEKCDCIKCSTRRELRNPKKG